MKGLNIVGTIPIPLRSDTHPGMVALIDDEDAHHGNKHQWNPAKDEDFGFIAYGDRLDEYEGFPITAYLARDIMGLGRLDLRQVDHINGDGLDCRRHNLQVVTRSELNRRIKWRKQHDGNPPLPLPTQHRGVSWDKQHRRWRASIYHHGRAVFIGLFDTDEEAARAFDARALELRGDKARINFPPVTTDETTGIRQLQHTDECSYVPLDADDRNVKAMIDPEDADMVSRRSWSHGTINPSGNPTPVTSIGGRTVALGRYLLMLRKGEKIAYADGNPLNCRRENLIVTGRGRMDHDEAEGDHEALVKAIRRHARNEMTAERRATAEREKRIALEEALFT